MPYLRDNTETVKLKSNPEYWVKIRTSLTWGEMKKIANTSEDGQVSYQVDQMLETCIADWNLDDAEGKKLELTQENIDKLEKPDVELLITTIGGKLEEPKDSKKDS